MAELSRETADLAFFNYVGSDGRFHYFTTADGRRYRVVRSDWKIPATFAADGKMALFVTVKDGKLTVPSAAETFGLSGDALQRPPGKR